MPQPTVAAIFAGQPKTITDDRGSWVSSIRRDRVTGPIRVDAAGLAGDRVTQPYHGGPGAAVCVHLSHHYDFWNRAYGMHLAPGSVGENVTLAGLTEDEVFVGDIVRVGSALVQVSGPRTPCANQARHIGRPDWLRLTIRESRTGFYLRVLEPGVIREGDAWTLHERLNQDASIPAMNRCVYLQFDDSFARHLLELRGLEEWWKEQIQEKLAQRTDHWTNAVATEESDTQ